MIKTYQPLKSFLFSILLVAYPLFVKADPSAESWLNFFIIGGFIILGYILTVSILYFHLKKRMNKITSIIGGILFGSLAILSFNASFNDDVPIMIITMNVGFCVAFVQDLFKIKVIPSYRYAIPLTVSFVMFFLLLFLKQHLF